MFYFTGSLTQATLNQVWTHAGGADEKGGKEGRGVDSEMGHRYLLPTFMLFAVAILERNGITHRQWSYGADGCGCGQALWTMGCAKP